MRRLRSLSKSLVHPVQSEQDKTGTAAFPRPLDHAAYMQYALSIAKQTPPRPTNFCVGAVIVDETENHVLTTGHTGELSGNTHAEECALAKFEKKVRASPPAWLSPNAVLVLYTTMEPCNKRNSGSTPCTQTIMDFNQKPLTKGITKVYIGVKEPETFVAGNEGKRKLGDAGIKYEQVPGLEDEILAVATAGHEKGPDAPNAM